LRLWLPYCNVLWLTRQQYNFWVLQIIKLNSIISIKDEKLKKFNNILVEESH
jgi:hypothetical protein